MLVGRVGGPESEGVSTIHAGPIFRLMPTGRFAAVGHGFVVCPFACRSPPQAQA